MNIACRSLFNACASSGGQSHSVCQVLWSGDRGKSSESGKYLGTASIATAANIKPLELGVLSDRGF